MSEGDKRAEGPIYYGWWIVAASFVGLALCQSPIAFLTLGVFMKPLGASFGWGRGAVSLALSAGALTLAFITPVMGTLIDRFGARRIMIPSMIGFGLLMASLYFLTASLLHFYAVYLALGIVGAGANNVSYMRVISAWFSKRRGLALGLASSGVPLGQAGATLLAQKLIDLYGWRSAYLGLGALVLFVGVPIVAWIIRERPADMGLDARAVAFEGTTTRSESVLPGLSLSEALASPVLWAMVGLGFLIAVSLHGIQIHMVPLLTDRGISADMAAGGFALLSGVSAVIGRMGVGWLFDRFFAPRVTMVAFLLPAAAMVMFVLSSSVWTAVALACLMGLGSGAESDVLGYLTSRYFGLRSFGQLYGYVFGGFMIGTAIGPYLFGAAFDWTHSYTVAIYISVSLILLMCGILALMPRFPSFKIPAPEPPETGYEPIPLD